MKNRIALLRADFSASALVAGFLVVLVGMTSSAVLVFQAASALGATPEDAGSWLGSLCLGIGLCSIVFSVKYRAPVAAAWSTAGAALLISGAHSATMPQAMGAFLFSAVLVFLCGVTGLFEKIMNRIPIAIASALLAGVLLHFALDSFLAFNSRPLLIGAMFLAYLFGRRLQPQWTMLVVLVVAVIVAAATGLLHFDQIDVALTQFHFVAPEFAPSVLLSVGLPLFIVSMASQNLTGIAVMRAHGYDTPVSPLMTWTGLANVLTSLFGGFNISLAAITAAIAMGPDAHPDPKKRYVAGVVAGALYMVIGIFAGTVTSVFAAFPKEMVLGIAGLALLATISSSLHRALEEPDQRKSAFITFAVTASGLSIYGIGSAFWGLVAGGFTYLILHKKKA